MPLEEYRAKRDFKRTPEPAGKKAPRKGALRFVIHKHHARALHYDLRLELDGVLLSWAVPKGPSLDPADKHLAVHVEDHPIEYGDFEGTIPEGEYGAGHVIVWDRGTWQPLGDAHAGLEKGDFKFELSGEKLHGTWVLVRLKPREGEKRENWLLIKERDEFVRPHAEYDVLAEEPDSVITHVGVEEIGKVDPATWHSNRPAAGKSRGKATAARRVGGAAGDEFSAVTPAGIGAGKPASISRGPSDPPRSAPSGPFPASVEFELATLVDEAPTGDEWVAEVKYDGYRVALALNDGRARAFTRSGADWTDHFAPLARAVEALPASSAIIDGEAVAFDEGGVSRFELLQRALGGHPEQIALAAFDLLFLNGHDLRDLPLTQRKELLGELLHELPRTSPLRFAAHVIGGAGEFYAQACRSDLEGIVCKRANGRYVPGRGREWLKVKCRQSQEFVVGGFTEGGGARAALGSILVGTYDGKRLVYHGRVGSGFAEKSMREMRARLEVLERPESPFDPPPHITGHVVHWAKPEVVAQVAFREWTSEGSLRQPVFLGVREDKAAREVVRESPALLGARGSGGVSGDARRQGAPQKARGPGRELVAADPAGATSTPAELVAADPPAAAPTTTATVLSIHISNPAKALFPDTPAFGKLDLARYYEAIAPLMLAEVADRPLTLLRCPGGGGQGCFYQRHPDLGMPAHVHRLKHTLGGEEVELLYVDSAEGLVALAQMGVGEIHTWMAKIDLPGRPDRICFDLDPGPDVKWPQICSAARFVRDECASLGFKPFVKSTGSKGLHVILPIEPVWDFTRIRALSKAIVDRLVREHPDALVGKMAKNVRGGHIFFDYLRNAEGASAVGPYSTRMKPGPPCSVPLEWDELTDDLDIRAFTPDKVLERVRTHKNPWRKLADSSARVGTLEKAEASLGK